MTRQDSAEPEGPVFAPPTPAGAVPDLSGVVLPGRDPGRDPAPSAPVGPGRHAPTPGGPDATARTAARGARRRRTLLVTGCVVAVALVSTGVALGVAQARERAWAPVDAALEAPREANVVQLVLGSCVRDLPDGDVRRVTAVPCDAEHVAQVVGRTDAGPDAVWPGAEALVRRAAAVCGPQDLGSAGREVDGVEFLVVTPTEPGWEAGDRTSLCLAVTAEPGTADLLR
ncbi:septum formation family protein [Puerhibacterium puerhi]|uniref:septum formation family protein n=1 Tax=Puerhibacterium puerhi TaxID=2692623 RepID=UPI00135C5ACB|nr:septum formation family protein [Puerhibacterium puerhi]